MEQESAGAVRVRRAGEADAVGLYELSLSAIRVSAAHHYSEEQLRAWAGRRNVQGHTRMIRDTEVFVAEVDGSVAGFCSVALHAVGSLEAGEVDQLFVHPECGARGVARALLATVAARAREAGLSALHTHASWRAEPVFERMGYRRVEVESVDVDGVVLTRVRMRMPLGDVEDGA